MYVSETCSDDHLMMSCINRDSEASVRRRAQKMNEFTDELILVTNALLSLVTHFVRILHDAWICVLVPACSDHVCTRAHVFVCVSACAHARVRIAFRIDFHLAHKSGRLCTHIVCVHGWCVHARCV